MKIAIIGAGVIGTTTAWELANDGHEVAVFERHSAAAEEASFATAGVIAPGHVSPWNGPGIRAQLLRVLTGAKGEIDVPWPPTPKQLDWMARWRHACALENYLANHSKLRHLAAASQARLHDITQATELVYERSEGFLILLRGKRERKRIEPMLEVLRSTDTKFDELDAEAARKIEPALNIEMEFAGAIHLPNAEAVNSRQFTLLLKRDAEQRFGAQFHFGCEIAPLSRSRPTTLMLAQGASGSTFDAVVICAGMGTSALLHQFEKSLPLMSIMPVHGYTVSAPIRDSIDAPNSAVFDQRHGVTIARLGQRVRVAGGAKLGGRADTLDSNTLRLLYRTLAQWFPGAAQMGTTGIQQWKGARPMTPSGLPLIGPSNVPGVWLNTAHGGIGWALACGSARLLADRMSGHDGGIDPAEFSCIDLSG